MEVTVEKHNKNNNSNNSNNNNNLLDWIERKSRPKKNSDNTPNGMNNSSSGGFLASLLQETILPTLATINNQETQLFLQDLLHRIGGEEL
jgi:hypothetical protein